MHNTRHNQHHMIKGGNPSDKIKKVMGYKVNRLSNTFKKLYGRHTDPVGQYKKSDCQMFADCAS